MIVWRRRRDLWQLPVQRAAIWELSAGLWAQQDILNSRCSVCVGAGFAPRLYRGGRLGIGVRGTGGLGSRGLGSRALGSRALGSRALGSRALGPISATHIAPWV